ncbi:hypothetical protein VTI74DRAFT_6434 [Chaetomium olivicolor]
MSQPILSLKSETTTSEEIPKATPHLLPCRVHHNGSVEPVQCFWEPKANDDGTSTAYFRGRKLQGKTVKLPEGYRGVVALVSGPKGPTRHPEDSQVVDLEAETSQGSLHSQAEFDDMVLWGHEAAPDPSADPYSKGVEEWITLAERIHSYSTPTSKEK